MVCGPWRCMGSGLYGCLQLAVSLSAVLLPTQHDVTSALHYRRLGRVLTWSAPRVKT